MARFQRGEIDVLVATTVIEVGVDVPNATVMVIEHAERFGLSQLHQLRGRIGRGTHKSYCVLMTGGKITTEGQRRLEAMVKTQDGFVIAELDLELRGPGEFFGTKQAGPPDHHLGVSLGTNRGAESFAEMLACDLLIVDPKLACVVDRDQYPASLVSLVSWLCSIR